MRYISTRGQVAPVTFSQAVMMGLATDGGLLLPESIPHISPQRLLEWVDLSFPDLAFEVISLFVGEEMPADDLHDLIERSYTTFSHKEVTPVLPVGGQFILELFHGPTLAFKDVALQFLGNLFEYILARDGGELNILGATSGDTGSAAIHGVRGRKGIRIFILHPQGRVSPVQERQMTTVLDENVHNIAIRGDFDDGQRIVKALFNDLAFKKSHNLGAVNSINWARILAQVVYYIYAWARISSCRRSQPITFAVPTGNFGDIFAGFVAARMGLPVDKLILATNRNDILARFIDTGVYQTGTVTPTISPSMDIQLSSNFERYLYYLLDEDPKQVAACMAELGERGKFAVPTEKRDQARALFQAAAISEEETLEQIRETYEKTGYVLDPHSAVGVRAARGIPEAICLATAHPAKFGDAVARAIGKEPNQPPEFDGLMARETRCAVLDADAAKVKAHMLAVMGEG